MTRYGLFGFAVMLALGAAGPAFAQGMSYEYGGGPYYEYRYGRGIEPPEVNVELSREYDRLLQIDAGFRNFRKRLECGPVNFSRELRDECFASFDQFEPIAAGYGYHGWSWRWRHGYRYWGARYHYHYHYHYHHHWHHHYY